MAAAPQHVRLNKRKLNGGFDGSGVVGDPTRASVEYGRKGIEFKVQTAVTQIRELMAKK